MSLVKVRSAEYLFAGSFLISDFCKSHVLKRHLPRKHIVRVVLSPQHKEILDDICLKLGQSESETLRVAFLEYARSVSLITEKVHGRP
jgi:hypothetical protein